MGDEIYVFTPKGDVVHLPQGSCAIDFAYHVHSGVGEKIVGAKADGKIIPITQPLQNTQIIEVITNPQAHPTENQLKVVKTSKARSRIHSWLLANDPTFEDKAAAEQRARDLDAQNERSRAIQEEKRKKRSVKGDNPEIAERNRYTGRIIVEGMKNFTYNLAGCCNPQPGDLIVGYTNKKGESIRRHVSLSSEFRTSKTEWWKSNGRKRLIKSKFYDFSVHSLSFFIDRDNRTKTVLERIK